MNIRTKTINLLEENIGQKLFGNYFLNMTTKVNVDQLDIIKIKNFYAQNRNICKL